MGLRTKWRPGDAFLLRHKDATCVVVEKKAGLLTHAGPEQNERSLLGELRAHLGDRGPGRGGRGGRRHLKAAHRLDRVVSGLLVLARTEAAFERLKAQFAARTVERRYLAGVRGCPEAAGRLEGFLDTEPLTVRVVDEAAPGARRAVTTFERLEHYPRGQASLLEVRLETGLRNQIRVQLAAHGFPLLGERKYDPDRPRAQGGERIFLHAAALGFDHPVTGERLRFEAGLPPDLRRWTARLARRPSPRCPPPSPRSRRRR
jgi:23S rRNA pseudouridine1911/1915/1917 synthase